MKKNLIYRKKCSAVCSLQSAVCSLQSAVCSLQSAVCGLQSAVCGLQSAVCSLRFHPTAFEWGWLTGWDYIHIFIYCWVVGRRYRCVEGRGVNLEFFDILLHLMRISEYVGLFSLKGLTLECICN